MKKGFTLIEVLTVIIILGVIGLIVFPAVNSMIKESRQDLYDEQLEEIRLAGEKWAYNNLDLLPTMEDEYITITLLELKRGGYLPLDIRDPRSGELLSNGLSLKIMYDNNDYNFEIEETITNTDISPESPSIILCGAVVMEFEINSDYPGSIYDGCNEVVAKDNDGNELEVITTYYDNGKEIAKIDTSVPKTYTVKYSATDEDRALTTVVSRTVIIYDNIKPVITLPAKITISSVDAANYDLMEDVIITDNSGEVITPVITGYDTSIGEKTVSYTACDSSSNCETKNRLIVIE